MALNYLATRFTCSWPWNILVMLCDGRMVCGCADPYGHRVLGDARTQSVHDVWTGPGVSALRQDINHGGSAFCGDCPLKLPLKENETPPHRGVDVPPLPSRMYIECTAACNISCLHACCAPETGITRTRRAGMLDVDLFRRVIDEAGPSLGRVDFFNYGEAFLHKRAVEMCAYIKSAFPHIYLYTSTNGLAFKDESARALVQTGIDEVTFSLDGASQETYARYRQRGTLDVALANLRAMVDEKRTRGLDVPVINWRYILFTWNDSDDEMARARQLAAEIGVDRLSWEITDHPEDGFSRRFVPGSSDYERIRYEVWDTTNLGNAIPAAMPRARIDVAAWRPGWPIICRAGRRVTVRTRVHNLSTRPFPKAASYGRRLVRLGAQLCDASGAVVSRDYARAWLPHTIEGGAQADVPIEIPAPGARGRYRVKFDLVYEGVDWFESCGSPTTSRAFWVI
jgi:MoaA/NifB/PqqE/SkfB family radical SAM enzyme